MNKAAEHATRQLEDTRNELKRTILELPDETKKSAAAMRQVIADQIGALTTLSMVVKKHSNQSDIAPATQFNIAQTAGAAPETVAPVPSLLPKSTSAQPAAIDSFNLSTKPLETKRTPAAEIKTSTASSAAAKNADGWALPDLLAAIGKPAKDGDLASFAASNSVTTGAGKEGRPALHIIENLNSLSVDLARALDHEAPIDLWHRYKKGERNVFTRRLYTLRGQRIFDEIEEKYRGDNEFKSDVDRYILDFEKLLNSVAKSDRENMLAETYLTSETGKVYLMLAHASGRLD